MTEPESEADLDSDPAADEEPAAEVGPERRCLVTGQVGPKERMVRFVLSPERVVVPDVAANLPGRGFWVTADRQIVERGRAKGQFVRAGQKSGKGKVDVPPDLADLIERLLAVRALQLLGLARRAGDLLLGFDAVDLALGGRKPLAVLIAASDGAADGRRKLAGRRGKAVLVEVFSSQEMGLALRRENVIHAAIRPGGLADRFVVEAARLSGFRPGSTHIPVAADVAVEPSGVSELKMVDD